MSARIGETYSTSRELPILFINILVDLGLSIVDQTRLSKVFESVDLSISISISNWRSDKVSEKKDKTITVLIS